MIQVILGGKGSGKTKRLIDMTNDVLNEERGNGTVIFIDDDKRYMYDLRHEIRFVDAGSFPAIHKCDARAFLAFVSGMLAADFDITMICVDAFLKLVVTPLSELEGFFADVEKLSTEQNCGFIFSISADEEEVPEFIKKYVKE